jgi:hypothetical protein
MAHINAASPASLVDLGLSNRIAFQTGLVSKKGFLAMASLGLFAHRRSNLYVR